MGLIDVLSEKDIAQIGAQLRSLLDRLLAQLRGDKIHIRGAVGGVMVDLAIWTEPKA